MNENFLEDWEDRPRDLNHDERVTELTKFIFTPITDFDHYEMPDRNHQILVAVEVGRNDDDPSKPHYFNLAHFVGATEDLKSAIDAYPTAEEVGTYNGKINENAISIVETQGNLDVFKESVNLELKRIDEEFYITNTLQEYAPALPFGYIYAQYPKQKAPDEIWLLSQWKEIIQEPEEVDEPEEIDETEEKNEDKNKVILWEYQASADRYTLILTLFSNRIDALEAGINNLFSDLSVAFDETDLEEILPMTDDERYLVFNMRLSKIEGEYAILTEFNDHQLLLEERKAKRELDNDDEMENDYDINERIFDELKERLYEAEKQMAFLLKEYDNKE